MTKNVKLVIVCPAPRSNWQKILVQGVGLKAAEPEIKLLETKYPDFSITVSDMKPVFTDGDGLPVYTVPFRENPFYLTINKDYNEKKADCAIATVGGFLCDDDEERCFAFTAAHALVPRDNIKQLGKLFGKWEEMCDKTRAMRKEIKGDHDDDQMLVHNHNQLHKMTVQDIRFGAQVYVKPNETTENHRKFVIDFLLFKYPQ